MIRPPSRIRSVLTHFLMGTLLTSGFSPSLYAMKGHLKNYDIGDWDSKTISDRGFSDIASQRPSQKGKAAIPMPTYDEPPIDDLNDFDSASTVEYGREARLIDDLDLRKYIKRLCLQITPTNYGELHEHATGFIKKGMFNRFDKGAFIQWRASAHGDDDRLPALLMALPLIKKLKVTVEWDTANRHFADIIADSVQGFEHLEEMDLSGCSFTNEELTAIIESTSSRKLTKLNLLGNQMTAGVVRDIRKRFKKLEELESDITDTGESLSPLPGMKVSVSPPMVNEPSKAQQEEKLRAEREREQLELKRVREELALQQKEIEERERRIAFEQQQLEAAKRQVEADKKQLASATSTSTSAPPPLPAPSVAAASAPLVAIERPIPGIARGHEDVYRRFMSGRLVYKGSSGERTFLISDALDTSLAGEFNLGGLMYTYNNKNYPIADYIRIKVGCRKVKEREQKTTIWIVPHFIAERSQNSFKSVWWSSPIGVFWTWGQDDLSEFDYLTTVQFDEISSKNLYELWRMTMSAGREHRERGSTGYGAPDRFPLFLIKF